MTLNDGINPKFLKIIITLCFIFYYTFLVNKTCLGTTLYLFYFKLLYKADSELEHMKLMKCRQSSLDTTQMHDNL